MDAITPMRYGIGARVARLEDDRFVTGRGRYGDDVDLQGQAYAAFVTSPVPAGRIVAIDAAAARAMPGVLEVLTGADLIAEGLGDIPCLAVTHTPLSRPDGTRTAAPPRQALAVDRVRYVGEPVAFVVAESVVAARDAAEAVTLQIEDAPFVIDPLEAVDGGPAVWADAPDNVAFLYRTGEAAAVDAALAASAHVASVTIPFTRIAMNPMEPRSALGSYDAKTKRYTLTCGTQNPHIIRDVLAEAVLRVPASSLRVVTPDLGGAFGLRSSVFADMVLVLVAAKRLGRPVKWTGTRSEAFLMDDMGRGLTMTATLGLDEEGAFTALKVSSVANLGAFMSLFGPISTFGNLGGLAGVYRTPLIAAEVRAVYTNTVPLSPYRGAGRPEAIACIELAIDAAARRTGLDRLNLRRHNMIEPSELPYKTGLSYTYDAGDFCQAMARAQEIADVAGYEARRAEAAARGKLRGLGLVNAIEASAGMRDEYAAVEVHADASATLTAGSLNHGQGHETTLRQAVAEQLPIPLQDIAFVSGDTDRVPHGTGSFGSRTAVLAGSATLQAGAAVMERARALAAHLLEAPLAEVSFEHERFSARGTNRTMSFQEVAAAAHDPARCPDELGVGLAASARVGADQGPTFPSGCHVCEVEVDPQTGEARVVRYAAAADMGTVINPTIVEGQLHGGVVQGLAQVFGEHVVYDGATGQPLTGSFMDYAMPRADDMPFIATDHCPTPTRKNPLGAKGAGEAGTVGALAAGLAAVADALAPLGVDGVSMPATADRIWRLIRAARPAGQPVAPLAPAAGSGDGSAGMS